jgi:hypothetical protein
MNKKNTHKITEREMRGLIKESIIEIVNENYENEGFTYTDMFGIKTRRENRVNAIRYARMFGSYFEKIQAIADELDRRLNLLTASKSQQVNEIADAVAKVGTKLFTKAGLKAFGKKASGVVSKIGLASIPAFIIGPQNVQAYFQKFNTNRAQATPQEVIAAYDGLANWLQNICGVLQQYPEILGAGQLDKGTLNGPEAVDGGPMFTAGDAVELAASIGVYAIPYVGWALGAIDLVHSFVHAGAEANKEGLEMVRNQIKYIDKAIVNINAALSGKSANGQQVDTGNQQTAQQLPNGYVIGKPAPFAQNDPQQVMRLQNYLGLTPTGKWDNNTQTSWDNWLRKTYMTGAGTGRVVKNTAKNIGRSIVSR